MTNHRVFEIREFPLQTTKVRLVSNLNGSTYVPKEKGWVEVTYSASLAECNSGDWWQFNRHLDQFGYCQIEI